MLGSGGTALLWTHLYGVKDQLEPTVLGLAFVFLLVGYGTKVGLVPLHNWLPDAHAEGPTPISAVLSGLLLNVALYAVVRSKALVDGALGTPLAGNLMMGFGLLSVVVAAFFLSRQKDVKRLFAYSSIEHMGLTTFAFGMGGPVATFAAMLHMTVHSLTKSAIFFAVGHAAQKTGTQVIADIRGLVITNPDHRLGFVARQPGDSRHAAIRRVRERVPDSYHRHARARVGDAVSADRTGRRVRRDLRQGAGHGVRRYDRAAPATFARAGSRVRASCAGVDARPLYPALSCCVVPPGRATTRMTLEKFNLQFARVRGAARVFRADVNAIEWITACRQVNERGGRLVALWGSERAPGFAVHAALADADGLLVLILPVPQDRPSYPGIEGIFPVAGRMQRAAYDMLGIEAQGDDDRRPWLRHAAWPSDKFPLRDDFDRACIYEPGTDDYPFVSVAGDGVHEIPVGPVTPAR